MSKVIIGTGRDLPPRVLHNDHLEAAVTDFDRARSGCSLDDWVADRIGARARHRVPEGEGTAHMATRAAERALANAGLVPADVDLLVLSTFTSDYRLPQSVSLVQSWLGTTAKCIQLEAACAGFIDGVLVATGLMDAFGYETALVVHAETMSSLMDPDLFLMQAIFGDGAGAVVLQDDPAAGVGVLAHHTATDGDKAFWLSAGGGTLSPITAATLADASHYMSIDYKSIFDFAIEKMVDSCLAVSLDAGVGLDDVDWVIAHQTGVNIIAAVADRLDMDPAKFLMTIDHTGNTSGATIPIALDEFHREGILQPGDTIVMPAVGAGMAWGALFVVWADLHARRGRQADAVIDLCDDAPALVPSLPEGSR